MNYLPDLLDPVLGPCRRRRPSGRDWKRFPTPLVVVVILAVAAGPEAVLATTGRYSYS